MNIKLEQMLLVGSLLFSSSLIDLRYKKISIPIVLIYLGMGVLWRIAFCKADFLSILLGMALGVFLILVSKLCKGAIGMGDGILLIVTGCMLGIQKNFELFFGGLLGAALVSLFLIVIKKVKKNYEIPFIPFLFLAYVGMMIHEI